MDYSMLDSSLWMVQWTDGKGEIEYQIDPSTNHNGLREGFYDITPYVPFFDQFLQRLPLLTLDQAKKVKIDLIKQLFESKRQLPFHYPVAAGDYWWDATDSSLYASTAGGVQSAIVKLNEVISRLNGLIPSINAIDSSICSQANTVFGQVNSNITDRGNGLIGQLQTMENEVGSAVVNPANAALNYQNSSWLATINSTLQRNSVPDGTGSTMFVAAPGLSGNIPATTDRLTYLTTVLNSTFIYVGTISYGGGISWTPITNVSPANAQWIPIGSTTPVNVTPDEQTAILKGIADRTNDLFVIKNQKIGEVNALTTVYDVIAYDVLADWPDIPVPPGYVLQAPVVPPSGGISIIGTPSGGGGSGIPEAPNDGVTYGRRSMVWNPALALSGDVLDGGTFISREGIF